MERRFVVYHPGTGDILRHGSAADEFWHLQAGEGEAIIEPTGEVDDRLHLIIGGELVEKLPVLPSLEDLKDVRRRLVDAALAAHYVAGYEHDFGAHGVHRLQLRDADDRTNWLTLLGICDEAIAAGQGETVMPIPVRTAANVELALTFAEAAAALRSMRDWAAAVLAHSWALKDAVAAATDAPALATLDLEDGWP